MTNESGVFLFSHSSHTSSFLPFSLGVWCLLSFRGHFLEGFLMQALRLIASLRKFLHLPRPSSLSTPACIDSDMGVSKRAKITLNDRLRTLTYSKAASLRAFVTGRPLVGMVVKADERVFAASKKARSHFSKVIC